MADSRIGDAARALVEKAWPDLLATMATGGNVGEACARAGFSRNVLYAYQRENPEARKQWEIAREESADAYADQVAAIIAAPISPADAPGARVRMDGLRWLAAKRNPRVYSDKQTLDLNVKTVDLTRIIQDANARLQAARQIGRVVEGTVITQALPQALEDIM